MAQNLEAIETPVAVMQPVERASNKQIIYTTYQSISDDTLFTDLTGSSIEFELRKKKDSPASFRKRNTNAGGGDDQILILTSSTFKLYFNPTDTEDLAEFTYYGRIKITTTGNAVYIIWIKIPFV